MPKELPRRELRDEPSKRASFNNYEEGAKARGVRNAEVAWGGVRRTAMSPTFYPKEKLTEFSQRTRAAIDAMKTRSASGPALGGQRTDITWTERMRAGRGDLNGLWNDVKAELAGRNLAEPTPDLRVARVLDWLELAERDGGFGSWLDQWNDMLGAPWSFDTLAESAERLQRLIEFHRDAVLTGFGELSGDEHARAIRARGELLSALDAIGAEIARQAELVLGGTLRLDLGLMFDALGVRLADASTRRQMEARLERAFANGRLAQAWSAELPEAVRDGTSGDRVVAKLGEWQAAEKLLRELFQIGSYEASDELGLARALSSAGLAVATALGSRMLDVEKPYGRTYDADDASQALAVFAAFGEQLATAQRRLADRCVTPKAREALRAGASALSKLRQDHPEPRKSIYGAREDFIEKGNRLDAYWRQSKDFVDKKLREVKIGGTTPNPVEALAIETARQRADQVAQQLGTGLEALLLRWSRRDPPSETLIQELCAEDKKFAQRYKSLSPAELKVELHDRVAQRSYRLGWELLAAIRDLKARIEHILADRPDQRMMLTRTLDALLDTIDEQLDQQYAGD